MVNLSFLQDLHKGAVTVKQGNVNLVCQTPKWRFQGQWKQTLKTNIGNENNMVNNLNCQVRQKSWLFSSIAKEAKEQDSGLLWATPSWGHNRTCYLPAVKVKREKGGGNVSIELIFSQSQVPEFSVVFNMAGNINFQISKEVIFLVMFSRFLSSSRW